MSSEFEPSTASVNTPHNAAEAHVDNIATGLGGAVVTAPMAALEAVSPVLSGKVSSAAAAVSRDMHPVLDISQVKPRMPLLRTFPRASVATRVRESPWMKAKGWGRKYQQMCSP